MNGLLSFLGRSGSPEVIRECRHCGTTLDGPGGACPACGWSGLAEYRLDG